MAAWRRPGIIDAFRTRLIEGMLAKGLTAQFAETVFKQIRGFGEYGFPESHAVSFALLAYVSAWLKHHYPAAFCAALLNSQPMGFYAPAQLVRDAREHGIEVRPVDVNHSRWDCTLEEPAPSPLPSPTGRETALRLGLRMIVGMPETHARRIEERQPLESMDQFKSIIPAPTVARLARADAFRSLELSRRASLWESLRPANTHPLFTAANDSEPALALPVMNPRAEVFADYQTVGLSLKAHPVGFFRAELNKLRVTTSAGLAGLKDGTFVRVAGLVLMRQRPSTAKGITFVTLEDETGQANLIVRIDVWEKFYTVARTAPAFIAHGRLQNQQGIIHVLVSRLENMNAALGDLRLASRDFH